MFLLRQVLILLIHQQFLCHGSWATRTATAAVVATPSPLAASATPLVVSSSEATLLTTRFFGAPLPSTAAQVQRPDDDIAVAGAVVPKRTAGRVAKRNVDDERRTNQLTPTSVVASAEMPDQPAEAGDFAADSDGDSEGAVGGVHKKRYKIIAVHTNCTRDLFDMHISLNREFRGLLYAKDFPLECRSRSASSGTSTNVTLRLPTSGCGVRAEPRPNGNMELSVRVMLQMEQKLRQSSDILRTIRCRLPPNAMGMTVTTQRDASRRPNTYRNGRMRFFEHSSGGGNNDGTGVDSSEDGSVDHGGGENGGGATLLPPKDLAQQQPTVTSSPRSTPRVRIWLELGGPDGSGAVEVGQATTLTVRAIVPGTMGVRVIDCAALDGLGDSTQQLLDERGCPIDEQVMPALHTRFKPAEEGWSKHSEDDLIEKTFTATFAAFKFPDRERLHVSCGVQLCKGNCPHINCRTRDLPALNIDKHLARIEVFNSLAVTAPQIEVDRLRYDRRYNMSVEEYPPSLRPLSPEGTLCLSVSKLAISFCVLGLIFLTAVVVAICSLIRSRRRAAMTCTLSANGSRLHRAEVCTSMFSSSSESAQSGRFPSKLFMPYYPNTLPYGRVY